MENGSEFLDTWVKTQKEYLEGWMDGVRKLQEALWSFGGAAGARTGAPPGDLFGLYRSWMENMADPFVELARQYNPDVIKDTYSRLFDVSGTYVKLYELWLSVARALQERSLDIGAYQDLFDISRYKEVIDVVFGTPMSAAFKESLDQSARLMDTWGPMSSRLMKPWMDALRENIEIFPRTLTGDTEPFMNIVHNLFNAFFSTFGKVFKLPAVGKNREEIELVLRSIDRLSVYMAKNTEFQHLIYTTGMRAMERVVDTVADRIRGGRGIRGFNEFLDLWLEVNEKAFLELFGTEEFSKMQAQLLEAALEARKHLNSLMELYLEDFPIALRSEMDDIAKTVYDWKRRVYDLEKKMKHFENGPFAEIRSEIGDIRRRVDALSSRAGPAETAEPGARRGRAAKR